MKEALINLADGLTDHHCTSAEKREFKKHARQYLQAAYDMGAEDYKASLEKKKDGPVGGLDAKPSEQTPTPPEVKPEPPVEAPAQAPVEAQTPEAPVAEPPVQQEPAVEPEQEEAKASKKKKDANKALKEF